MADITLCKDDTCPKRYECFRYMTIPSNTMQSYFMSSPRIGDECDYFSEDRNGRKLKKTRGIE